MIEISNIIKHYNKGHINSVKALDGVSLTFPDTGFIGILGRSGCGKTTLLNVLGGTTTISAGKVLINGEDLYKKTDDIRNRNIGYIFQNYLLIRDETVFENVSDSLILAGVTDEKEIEKRVNEALDYVGMSRYRNRRPDSLSGGQQQRVAIARAIAKQPAIVLADEPTGNLDKQNTVIVMDILKKLSKDHLVILVTHEKDLASEYCDRIIEMNDGKVTGMQGKDPESSGKTEKKELSKEAVTGRLFDLKKSFKQSIKATGIRKRSVIILGIFLVLSSFMEVLLTGYLSVNVKEFIDKVKANDPAIFYIDPDNAKGPVSKKELILDKNSGIDAVSFLTEGKAARIGSGEFTMPVFPSSEWGFNNSEMPNRVACSYWDASLIKDLKPSAGKVSPGKGEVVITTALAQKMEDNMQISALNSPDDLLGFGFYGLNPTAREEHKIVGVIESDRSYVYCSTDDIDEAYFSVTSPEGCLTKVSGSDKVAEGEITVCHANKDFEKLFKKGDSLTIHGRKIKIGEVINKHFPYSKYIETKKIPKKSKIETDMTDFEYFDYYMEEYGDYVNYCLEHGDSVKITPYMKAYADGNKHVLNFMKAEESGNEEFKYYLVTKAILGKEPTEDEIDENRGAVENLEQRVSNDIFGNKDYKTDEYDIEYVFNPKDLALFADLVGISDYRMGKDIKTLSPILLLHSTDPEKTKDYLRDKYGEASEATSDMIDGMEPFTYLTPDSFTYRAVAENQGALFISLFLIAFFYVVIVLSLFMILKLEIADRIKYIGILRSIGVTRKNILFRFTIENILLFFKTVFPGFLAASAILLFLEYNKALPMASDVVNYPLPLCFATAAVLFLTMLVIGIIPVHSIIRRSPSDIMAKYDI